MGTFLWECAVFAAILVAPVACCWGARRARRGYDRSAGAHAWRYLAVGNLCALLACVTLLLAIAECYYRFWYDTTDGLALTRISRSWTSRYFHYNNAGFRARKEYTSLPAADRTRVTFLGDSFAVGYGVPRVQDRLSNLVEQRSKAWRETHCFANTGLDTQAECELLQRAFAEGYQTDRVVLVYCPNDVSDLIPTWHVAGERIERRAKQLGPLRASYALDMLWSRWIVATDPDASRYPETVLEGYRGDIWQKQTERLRAIRDLCDANGAPLLIVLFPFLHDLDDVRFHQAYDQLADFCEREGIPFLNLLPTLRPHGEEGLIVNRFDPHPNEWAHSLAADAVIEFLDELDARLGPLERLCQDQSEQVSRLTERRFSDRVAVPSP